MMSQAIGRGAFFRCVAGLVLLVIVAALVGTPASGQDVVLVRDGAAAASIVIAAEHDLADRPAPKGDAARGPWSSVNVWDAATEFQHYIEKMSGARLPIVTDDQPVRGTVVLIGRSRLTDAIAGLKIPTGRTKQLQEEGLVVWCDGDRLVLAGNDTEPFRGTRYAVCEMLHRLGVRWFMPTEFGEVVPKMPTITVKAMNVRQRPDFALRTYWVSGSADTRAEMAWQIHNKMSPDMQNWYGVPGDGSVQYLLPQDRIDEHPEWFALHPDGSRNPKMPCMTDPGIIQHMVETLKARARNGGRAAAFSPDDGMPRCYCDGCRAMSTGFDGFDVNPRDPVPTSSTTNEWMYFVTNVLAKVNDEFPEFVITSNGYANRDIPPELNDLNPSNTLAIMFANIAACTIHNYGDEHCWQVQRQGQMVRRWCELSDKVWRYGYLYTMLVAKDTLTPMVHRERVDIPQLKQWGLWGFFDQDDGDWSMVGIPTRYVRARLEWDVDTDVDAVLHDYYQKWYGRAAAPMKTFYDALENAFATSLAHGHEDVILPEIYTADLLKRLGAAMADAKRRARMQTEKLHVRMDELMYEHIRAYVLFESAKQACDYAKAIEHANRMIVLKKEFNAITPFMGHRMHPVYDAAWKKREMQADLCRMVGPEGDLLTVLPVGARFRTDPFDDGIFERWQRTNFDDSDWDTLTTTAGWQSQGWRSEDGRPYLGLAWYRMDVDVPATDREVFLEAPSVTNEAWVWVNGKYAGHRPWGGPWGRPKRFIVDISGLVEPGRTNQITFRVLCNINVFGVNGIYNRMFLYAKDPNPIARMAQQGVAPAPAIEQAQKARIHIERIAGNREYQVWGGPHKDGRDARLLVRNPRPEDDIPPQPAGKLVYLFASYTDDAGEISKPSPPFALDLRAGVDDE